MKFAIVDIETTGGSAAHDRITEIAIYVHDGEKITDEFTTLVNPECMIPPFISRLTGITNEMVEDAPRFFEVAKQIVQMTEGAVFVAHNAPFDYGFIREEYKTLGYNFSREYLCTVRLSRKFFPGFRSYSLGNICASLNINIENRHRAGGDALATVKLFERVLEKNIDKNDLTSFIKNDYLNLRFPPDFDRTILDRLPERPGVYYLHDVNGRIVYVGKSNNIRKRILSHFANKQSRKAIELRNSVRDITFEETGSELIALLLESDEIKKKQPFYNHSQKRIILNHCIYLSENENGYQTLNISKSNRELEGKEIITAGTYDQALDLMDRLIQKFRLCQKYCGNSDIAHGCFAYSVRQCIGACVGKESAGDYNKRVMQAVESLQYKEPNFMIIGDGRSASEKSIVRIENGKYVGFGYFEPEFSGTDPYQLKDLVNYREDNRDVTRIIRHYLVHSGKNILTY